VLRCEPQSLKLVNFDPAFRVSFEQVGCMRFCEKIQGYNVQVTKEFSLNFNGVRQGLLTLLSKYQRRQWLLQLRFQSRGRSGLKVCLLIQFSTLIS
jgi:hypothetical protein